MYDKRGNRRQWWTRETTETFSKKAECFVQQYDNYNVTVFGNPIKVLAIRIFLFLRSFRRAENQNELIEIPRTQVNGKLTQNENIADIGGLTHAYAAYRKYVSVHGAENGLPGLEELSPEQLFFVGYATVRIVMIIVVERGGGG